MSLGPIRVKLCFYARFTRKAFPALSRLKRRPGSAVFDPVDPMTPSAATIKYSGGVHSRRTDFLCAVLFSLGIHGAFLFGERFFAPPRQARSVPVAEPAVVQMEMPPLDEDPIEVVEPLGEQEPSPSVAVPSLADVPSIGPLTAFTQPLQPPAPPGLEVSKTLGTIPTHRGTGTAFGKGIGDLFDVATLDQTPIARSTFPPDYPYEMRRQAQQGWVEVDYIVDRSGDVVAAQILRSSHEAFERPALDALRRWKFRPGRKGGRAVNSRIQQVIKFSLEAGS